MGSWLWSETYVRVVNAIWQEGISSCRMHDDNFYKITAALQFNTIPFNNYRKRIYTRIWLSTNQSQTTGLTRSKLAPKIAKTSLFRRQSIGRQRIFPVLDFQHWQINSMFGSRISSFFFFFLEFYMSFCLRYVSDCVFGQWTELLKMRSLLF